VLANAIVPEFFKVVRIDSLARRFVLAPFARSQAKLDELWEPPSASMGEYYAGLTKTLALGFLFGPAMPVVFFITALTLVITYWSTKYALLRVCKQPPAMHEGVSERFREGVSFLLLGSAILELIVVNSRMGDDWSAAERSRTRGAPPPLPLLLLALLLGAGRCACAWFAWALCELALLLLLLPCRVAALVLLGYDESADARQHGLSCAQTFRLPVAPAPTAMPGCCAGTRTARALAFPARALSLSSPPFRSLTRALAALAVVPPTRHSPHARTSDPHACASPRSLPGRSRHSCAHANRQPHARRAAAGAALPIAAIVLWVFYKLVPTQYLPCLRGYVDTKSDDTGGKAFSSLQGLERYSCPISQPVPSIVDSNRASNVHAQVVGSSSRRPSVVDTQVSIQMQQQGASAPPAQAEPSGVATDPAFAPREPYQRPYAEATHATRPPQAMHAEHQPHHQSHYTPPMQYAPPYSQQHHHYQQGPAHAPPPPVAYAPSLLSVTCPPNVGPGAQLLVQGPSGQRVMVTVPPGVVPGMIFHVSV
jgi:hypothetical protein